MRQEEEEDRQDEAAAPVDVDEAAHRERALRAVQLDGLSARELVRHLGRVVRAARLTRSLTLLEDALDAVEDHDGGVDMNSAVVIEAEDLLIMLQEDGTASDLASDSDEDDFFS